MRGWNGKTKRNLTTAGKQKAARDAEIAETNDRMKIIEEFQKYNTAKLLGIAQNDKNETRRQIAARMLELYA